MIPRTVKVKMMFPMINGLFSHLNYQFPEILGPVTPAQLDIIFCTNYGMKSVAPVVLVIHEDSSTPVLTDSELSRLSDLILAMYKYKWDKLATLLMLEYDPIHNYLDDYNEHIEETIDNSDTLTHNTTVSDDTTITSTRSVTDGGVETHRKTTTLNDTITDGGTESRLRVGSGTENSSDGGSESHMHVITGTDNETNGGTETHSKQTSGTSTRTDDLEQEVTGNIVNDIYGFNSDEPVGDNTSDSHKVQLDTGTQSTQSSGTESETINGGLTKNTTKSGRDELTVTGGLTKAISNSDRDELTITGGLTKTKVGSGSETSTIEGGLTKATQGSDVTQGAKRTTGTEGNEGTSERVRDREFRHLGNIGNLTTQQLLTQEIELWRWNFIQEVLNDVKDFLTIPVYD